MNQFDEKSVLSDLPPSLRKDIFDNLYTGALVGVPIFKNMSNQFITEVCLRMSPISFPQFHSVYGQGELGYDMYFITKGSVAVLLNEMPHNPSTDELQTMVESCVLWGTRGARIRVEARDNRVHPIVHHDDAERGSHGRAVPAELRVQG